MLNAKLVSMMVIPGLLLMLPAANAEQMRPKLVLQITVDALRGDLPQRYSGVIGDGGLRYLLDKGVHYTNAHYQHANTETIVGHTSLSTGTIPAAHGMVGNVWFDREQDRLVYNVEDPEYRLMTAGADVDQDTEIDPTQRTARSDGRSPRNILASTFGDELAIATGGAAKVFGVSIKDRGAIAMAGQAGKAFWFSKKSGEFVTSNYYYDRYPEWVTRWNQADPTAAYSGKSWQLAHDKSRYLFGDRDDNDYETDVAGFGRTFPHAFGNQDDGYYTTKLTLSPAGDELTLAFTKALIINEGIGEDDVPDYLSVSFSSTDYVGHIFGASSLESEDNLAHLDHTLGGLFAFVDKHVGLEHTLIVFSADHGQPEAPGYLNELGIGNAHYFDVDSMDTSGAITTLKEKFGINEPLIEAFFQPYLYLNQEVIQEHDLDQTEIENVIATEVLKFPGIAHAVSSHALRSGAVADTGITRSVLHNYYSKRSGDVYLVFQPNVFINDFDGLTVSTTHGSPWRYDTYVPVIFAGYGLQSARIDRRVAPYDIAPTLAALLGTKPPSSTFGSVLPEVVSRHRTADH